MGLYRGGLRWRSARGCRRYLGQFFWEKATIVTSLPVESLTESELGALRAFLASDAFADDARRLSGLEELQGFLAAVICTPDMILPSEWLGFAFGEPRYENREQAECITKLLLRFYNDVSHDLSRAEKVALWFSSRPVESGETASAVNLWCRGFIRGMAVRDRDWRAPNHDDELNRGLLPILALGGTSPKNPLAGIGKTQRDELIGLLPGSVTVLYAHMRRLSRPQTQEAAAHSGVLPLPRYDAAELAARSLPELLAIMVRDEDRVPRNVIDELVRRGAETLEVLRLRLEGDEFWSDEVLSGEWWLRLHAVMVLGLLPDAEAGELLVVAMRRMSEEEDDDLQGWFGGYWPALFRNKPAGVVEPLRMLSEDRELDWYIRSYAAETVVALAAREGAADLEAALDWLVRLVADETEDWEMRLASAGTLLDFPRASCRSLLEALAARQKKPDVHFNQEDIEEAYARGEDRPGWRRFDDPWRFYTPEAIAVRQKRWAEEDAERARREADESEDYFEDEESAPYVRPEPKIGRNNLCPCGRGKKYKKCHGAPDAGPVLH